MRLRPNYQSLDGKPGPRPNGTSLTQSDDELLDATSEFEAERDRPPLNGRRPTLFSQIDPENEEEVGT